MMALKIRALQACVTSASTGKNRQHPGKVYCLTARFAVSNKTTTKDHDESKITHIRCFDADSQTPDIRFYIKSITNYIPGKPLSATLICGLGSPKRFIDDIGTFAASTGIQINKVITRPDHDKHFAQVVQKEISCGNDIIISQKDACRLPQTNLEHPKLHIAIQEIEVSAHLTLHSS